MTFATAEAMAAHLRQAISDERFIAQTVRRTFPDYRAPRIQPLPAQIRKPLATDPPEPISAFERARPVAMDAANTAFVTRMWGAHPEILTHLASQGLQVAGAKRR